MEQRQQETIPLHSLAIKKRASLAEQSLCKRCREYSVTRSPNRIPLNREKWTNFVTQIVDSESGLHQIRLVNWFFPKEVFKQIVNLRKTNSKLYKLTNRTIDQSLFNWPLVAQTKAQTMPLWIQTTFNPSNRGNGCNKLLHAWGAQQPRSVGDLAPWRKDREILTNLPTDLRRFCLLTIVQHFNATKLIDKALLSAKRAYQLFLNN